MPYRFTPLVNNEYYHIYNRGIASQPTFINKRDYQRFLLCLQYYQYKDVPLRLSKLLQITKDLRDDILKNLEIKNNKIIKLTAFCLMPNHFHLLLKQQSENGVSRFLRLACNSYARFFNTKHQRFGAVFQGMFKAVHVHTDEQLLHLSRYIHLNPLVSYIVRESDFLNYPWSSLQYYLNSSKDDSVDPKIILENFSQNKDHLKFVLDQADYGKKLEEIKHLTLE